MLEESYKSTGTTSPILIPKGDGMPIKMGENYFAIQVRSAQAAFKGHLWEKVNQLVIASSVYLNHQLFGNQPVEALNQSREVDKGRAEQLGISLNLIDWVPAMMDHISISFDFILDKQNKLLQFTNMINKDWFKMAISFTPGGIMAAKVVGGIARELLNNFLSADERQPILRFNGDFNIASDSLREGYYAILGTRDDRNPLPRPFPKLSIHDGDLVADGMPVTQWSYILLEVHRIYALGRHHGIGQPWYTKLIEAENIAQDVENEKSISKEERKGRFQVCQNLLKEMRTLLNADASYLPREARSIHQAAFRNCKEKILGSITDRMRHSEQFDESLMRIDEETRELLGVVDERALYNAVSTYAEQIAHSRQVMKQIGIH